VKNLFRYFLIILWILSSHSALAEETRLLPIPKLQVGIIGDQTGAYDIQQSYSILQEGVNILKNQNLDVVIHVGDLVESREPIAVYESLFDQATSILDQLSVPWFITPGDHDVNPPTFQQNSTDRSRETLFKQLYSTYVPAVAEHLYYSFDVKEYHFVALYSHEHLHVDSRWGNVFLARISDTQLEWLKQDLEANKSAQAIIVFIHQPLWYNWSSWKEIHNVLRRYPVAAVIAGHFHYNQDEGKIDKIRYIVVGATGGVTKQASPYAGNTQHVTIMTLKKRHRTRFKILPIGNTEPQSFTPRQYMDRVQAIDQMLSNLWNFSDLNPVYLKDNQLVASCETLTPATLHLTLGNPTDLPLRMKVEVEASEIDTSSAGFAPEVCSQTISDYECILFPSARTFVSNTSVVTIDNYSSAIWESELALNGTPPIGTPLNLSIRMSFPSEVSELFIEKTVSTTLQLCSS
jgi:3',5'-cyclic AMP phosphodiesterase CpdA